MNDKKTSGKAIDRNLGNMFDFKTAEFLEATRRMVECLDPIVALEETLIDLFTLKDP